LFKKPLLVLAPLAGYTDLPFRRVAKKFGADLTVSEMISAHALAYNPKKTLLFVQKDALETPYSVQIAANSPEIAAKAIEILNDVEGIDILDLNCGCPAPKVVGGMSGSALLKDLSKMAAILETVKKISKTKMVSAKIRIGFDKKNGVEIAKVCEDSGMDFIAVHGRTRSQKFSGMVDYDEIAAIKSSVKIPVIANGDIDSVEKANFVLEKTNADGIMIGRAAVGTPWIFAQLKNGNFGEADIATRMAVALEHFDAMVEYYGERGVVIFRKQLHTYAKGLDGASKFRCIINSQTDAIKTRELIEELFSHNI
jgi:tRNA-dihydrouridine synthase B